MCNCKGVFGNIFGHKFKIFKIFESPKYMESLSGNFTNEALNNILDKMYERKYEIFCKRCGIKPGKES